MGTVVPIADYVGNPASRSPWLRPPAPWEPCYRPAATGRHRRHQDVTSQPRTDTPPDITPPPSTPPDIVA